MKKQALGILLSIAALTGCVSNTANVQQDDISNKILACNNNNAKACRAVGDQIAFDFNNEFSDEKKSEFIKQFNTAISKSNKNNFIDLTDKKVRTETVLPYWNKACDLDNYYCADLGFTYSANADGGWIDVKRDLVKAKSYMMKSYNDYVSNGPTSALHDYSHYYETLYRISEIYKELNDSTNSELYYRKACLLDSKSNCK